MHPNPTSTLRGAAATVAIVVATVLIPVTPASAAPSPATVTGSVTGPDGEALAGVHVSVDGVGTDTTSAGRYRLTGVTPGRKVRVFAVPDPHYTGGTSATGYTRTYSPYLTLAKATTTTVDLRLRVGGAMSGRVVDDRTGSPVPNAGVYLSYDFYGPSGGGSRGGGQLVTSSADGTWWVRGLDPERLWHVNVTPHGTSPEAEYGWEPGYYRDSSPVRVYAGAVTRGISFALVPYAKVVATVTAPAGSAAPTVQARGAGGASSERSGVGRFALHPSAQYGAAETSGVVCAFGDFTRYDPLGLARQCTAVPFRAVGQSQVRFDLAVGGAVTGTLSGDSGFFDVWVDVGGRRVDGTPDRYSGGAVHAFTLGNLPTGTYVVHARDRDGRVGQSAPIQVVQGKVKKDVTIAVQ